MHLPPDAHSVLTTGINWLYEEQPEGALITHHGMILYADSARAYSFVPSGPRGLPTVTVQLYRPARDANFMPTEHLGAYEADDLAMFLDDMGHPVNRTWSGNDGITGTVELEHRAHPTLRAAQEGYAQGCPLHTTPESNAFCGCGWDREGRALLRFPDPPAMRRMPSRHAAPRHQEPRHETPEPATTPTATEPAESRPEFAPITTSLLHRIRAGLRRIAEPPRTRVEVSFTCDRCGVRADFRARTAEPLTEPLGELWHNHRCKSD